MYFYDLRSKSHVYRCAKSLQNPQANGVKSVIEPLQRLIAVAHKNAADVLLHCTHYPKCGSDKNGESKGTKALILALSTENASTPASTTR